MLSAFLRISLLWRLPGAPNRAVRGVRAWAWLCASADDLDEKQRCLETILELEQGLE